jgi:predicted O-linked N-acetylglucosamine transferase (SPINDLY family)
MTDALVSQAMQIALQHHRAGRLEQADQIYRQILAQWPEHAPALHHLGLIALQTGRNRLAIDLIRRAIAREPSAEGQNDLGIALNADGKADDAISSYRQALALRPGYIEAYNNLGNALGQQGHLDEAIAVYRQAIALRPNLPESHSNLGNALKQKQQLDEAIAAYRQAIALRPAYAEAWYNLGIALGDRGQFDQAIEAYRRAIALRPNYTAAHNNLGSALKDKGRTDEAVAVFRRAIALSPDLPEAHYNLGITLPWQLDESIAALRQAIALRPSYHEAHSALVVSLHYPPACDPETIAEEHRRWGRAHAEPLRKFIQPHANDRNPERRLRIGYVSPDFKQHAVAPMVLPLLACHDRERFELFCYAQVPKPDAMTERFRAQADQWRGTVGLSDEQMAGLIRQDRIDILVDLAGHTAGGRLLVFARKPAPVQIARQGYPDTTGLSTMDYRMTDALADPPGLTEGLHSEQLIRLPRTNWIYQPPENSPAPRQAPDLHPSGGSITFGCFNNFAKVTEPMLLLWGRVLAAVPGSRLLLKAQGLSSPGTRQRVGELFTRAGIDHQRLELRGFEPGHGSHLALYNRVDIALDPFPYHGTTTTCEALWMGVPVVTLAGQTHVSRVGVSLLTNMGLGELIAANQEDYKKIAVELAFDRPRLCHLHSTLRQQMAQSPLMDAPSFARDIEAVYRDVWRKWCANP